SLGGGRACRVGHVCSSLLGAPCSVALSVYTTSLRDPGYVSPERAVVRLFSCGENMSRRWPRRWKATRCLWGEEVRSLRRQARYRDRPAGSRRARPVRSESGRRGCSLVASTPTTPTCRQRTEVGRCVGYGDPVSPQEAPSSPRS